MIDYDVVVVGGGINGAAVARDAAGRGLRVFLAEKGDFGQATSSASSKLIHGGLRYLEQYEFRLVAESLREREVMLKIAPHLTRPLRFLLPISRAQPRPAWRYRAALLLYEILAGAARIERTGHVRIPAECDREQSVARELNVDSLRAILHYPDVQVDDSRLVIATLLDAKRRGATVINRAEVTLVAHAEQGFMVDYRSRGHSLRVACRAVINAAGPWADRVARLRGDAKTPPRHLKLVRGSHLVVRKPACAPDCAYTLPLADGRVVFVIPWLEGLRIVGTTDVEHPGSPDEVACSQSEESYLLQAYNESFQARIGPGDVIRRWSGVRPLLDDGADSPSRLTRDYSLSVQRSGVGMTIDIFGGKLTSHRRVAERVVEALRPLWPSLGRSWTADQPLVGGQLSASGLAALAKSGPTVLPESIRNRWVYAYGSVASELFERVERDHTAALEVVPGVPIVELEHAREQEFAATAEDFLERRTKLALTLDAASQKRVGAWFSQGVATSLRTVI